MSNDYSDPTDPKNIHRADQGMAWMVDNLPGLWWGLYSGMKGKGFTDVQAFTVLIAYIQSTTKG